jgi:hypothetical protein
MKIIIEIAPSSPDEPLRAAARRVLNLIAPPPPGQYDPGCEYSPTFDYNRRAEAGPALAELRRLAGF